MSAIFPLTPGRPARPRVPGARSASARPSLALVEALILSLLASLLGLRPRAARAWHPLPTSQEDSAAEPFALAPRAPLRPRHIHDGTHLVCDHPILWVIGPGPNRGLRPLPRALPIPHAGIPRSAQVRAPPDRAHAPRA
jgi:hypothetical protein